MVDNFLSFSSPNKDVTADLGTFGFSGTVCSKEQNEDAASSVAVKVKLVSNCGQSRDSSGLVRGVFAVCQVVATGEEMSIQSPSPIVPSVSFSIQRCVQDQLGCASAGPDSSGGVYRGRTKSPYQHLQRSDRRRVGVLISNNATMVVYIKKQGGMFLEWYAISHRRYSFGQSSL